MELNTFQKDVLKKPDKDISTQSFEDLIDKGIKNTVELLYSLKYVKNNLIGS